MWVAALGAGSAIMGCNQEAPPPATVSAAAKAAEQKAIADKAAAETAAALKVAGEKAAADKAAALKAAGEKAAANEAAALKVAGEKAAAAEAAALKAAGEKAAKDKAAGEKAAAAKAVADKVAADKAAAEKAAQQAQAEAASLPPDLVETKAEISRTLGQIDVTMAKLGDLSTATGDLDKPSKGALEAIKALNTEIQALQKRGDDMRNRGAAYFEDWQKELAAMSTPDVLAIATKRKDELAAKYAEVLTAMQESRAALDAYWADMKAIQKAVDDDLTPDTQKLLVPQLKAAKEKATTLKSRVEVVAAKLNQVSVLYTKP